MKIRIYFVVGLDSLMVAALGVLAWWALRQQWQPTYKGRPLSYWFSELPLTMVNGRSVASAEQATDRRWTSGAQREDPETSWRRFGG